MDVTYTHACIVLGCQADATCQDHKGYTKWALQDGEIPCESEEVAFLEDRAIWYCAEHAKDYLFPVIDQAVGNTTRRIIKDFIWDGMWQ